MIHSEKTASCRHLLAKWHNLQKQSATYRHTYRIASLNRQNKSKNQKKRVQHVVLNTSTQRSVCVCLSRFSSVPQTCVYSDVTRLHPWRSRNRGGTECTATDFDRLVCLCMWGETDGERDCCIRADAGARETWYARLQHGACSIIVVSSCINKLGQSLSSETILHLKISVCSSRGFAPTSLHVKIMIHLIV